MEGYRLGVINIVDNNQKINIKGNISKDKFELIEKHTLNIHHHILEQELYYIFIMNFIEFNRYFEDTLASFSKHKRINLLDNKLPELKYISRNANRFLFNFLTSARTYIDHTETYLKRKFNNSSNEVNEFIEKTKNLYDNHFEYRFMYKLRNYAQHCGLPINKITFSYENKDILKKKLLLTPLFEKNEFLKNYDSWGIRINDDFKYLPDEISVTQIIKAYYKNIEELNNVFLNIEKKSINVSVEYLEKFQQEHYALNEITENTQCCIFYNFKLKHPNSYEGSTFSTYVYPKEMIETIKSYS